MESPKLVRLSARERDPLTKYIDFDSIRFEDDVIRIEDLNFYFPTILKEAKKLPKKTIKKYKRTIQTFMTTAASFLTLPLTSLANALPSTPSTTLPLKAEGIPPEILALLLKLLVISVGSAVIFGAILLVAAGVKRMLGNKKESNEWTVDIIKGLVQVMIAVPVVFLIYYVVSLLFSGSGWFVSPF